MAVSGLISIDDGSVAGADVFEVAVGLRLAAYTALSCNSWAVWAPKMSGSIVLVVEPVSAGQLITTIGSAEDALAPRTPRILVESVPAEDYPTRR